MSEHSMQKLNEEERRSKMQRLNDYSYYEDLEQMEYLRRNPNDPVWLYPLIAGCIMVMFITMAISIRSCTVNLTVVDKGGLDCSNCHNAELERKQKLVAYFARKGSKEPERMADAVVRTNNSRLLAAVATVESNGNPKVRKSGYMRRHSGAFQVSEKDWGAVSHDPIKQALQAEAILAELTDSNKGNLVKTLNAYGGESNKSSGRYAYVILAELAEVPR